MTLQTFFQQHPKVAVAFSGGTDSSFLLYAARQYAKEVHAYYVRSAFQPQFEYNDAVELVKQLDVSLTVIQADVLASPVVSANPPDRCYHCKKVIFSKIVEAADQDGFLVLLDGTNASDDASDRPGMKALQELKVLSPLRECGLTKTQIRQLSKEAGLFTWNKPAYACLATRVPTGVCITAERLSKTERTENFLMTLGFSDFRVRMIVDEKGLEHAHLQIKKSHLPLLIENREQIILQLKKDYDSVLFDLETRDEQ